MITGISKKVIFIILFFINFTQSLKSADLLKINQNKTHPINKLGNLKLPNAEKQLISKTSFIQNIERINSAKKSLEKKILPLFAYIDIGQSHNELIIESDKQYEINGVIYAEGNVSLTHQGKLLRADNLIFDKLNKTLIAEGNISLVFGKQMFKMAKFEYNFLTEKGYLLDVKGSINTKNLISDLNSDFSISDIEKIHALLNFKKTEVLSTPGKLDNWVFFTEKIDIEGKKWKSAKSIFTNDLLELKQAKIVINSLETIFKDDELKFKSSLNYLILEEKVSIPFWFGNRTLRKSGEDFRYKNSWNLGYDNLDKDGYFIGRKLKTINLNDDFVLDLEPQFLIQRSFNGYTNSFVSEGDLITGNRVKRDTAFADYFGLESEIKGKIDNWDLFIEKQINTFDINKFNDALRLKTSLSKEINFLNSKWKKSFYGVYRDRVWNGSLGEAEIYRGFGAKLEKRNKWETNNIYKNDILSFGLANLKAEELDSKNLLTNVKGNLFYSLSQKIPISVYKPKNHFIDSSYEYIAKPISKGLSLNTRFEASYSLYEKGKHQEYLGFGLGPELIIGDFKNRIFDYTRISIFPFYKLKNGNSVFKFDQISDKFTLDMSFDQQIFGPLMLQSNGSLNLDNDSEDYGDFINSRIALNWKKRSYEFGIFYQPHNEAGGIAFKLFGFK